MKTHENDALIEDFKKTVLNFATSKDDFENKIKAKLRIMDVGETIKVKIDSGIKTIKKVSESSDEVID